MIEEGILALANQATADLIGGRFYADTLPRTVTYPAAIVHAGIGGRNERTFDGPGMQIDRYQFDFAGKHRRDVTAAREAVVALLDDFGGVLPNGAQVEAIEYIQPLKLPYDDDKQVFWCGCEFYIKYNR